MVEKINKLLDTKNPVKSLQVIIEEIGNQIVFTTSFGIEDQVITDIIFSNKLPIKIVAIDTGRLFEETHRVHLSTLEKYKQIIEVYYPETTELENLVSKKGPYSFYDSIENRKECCNIRKVKPLKRILKDTSCWVTGIRSNQSNGRTQMQMLDWDRNYQVYKLNPLLNWNLVEVEDYLKEHNVPYNSLHHKGFVSIGCAPCTRAINSGEDFRSGRWWWEHNSTKECGLHSNQ